MNRPRISAPSVALLVAVTVVAVGAGGFAVAAGTSSGEIKGCSAKKTGALRVITKGKCKRTERTVKWNKQGPAGPAGAAGATTVTVRTATLSVPYGNCNRPFSSAPYMCRGEGTATASCEPGERATGGGYGKSTDAAALADVVENGPAQTTGTPTGWTVSMNVSTSSNSATPAPGEVPVRVLCAAP